MIHKLFTQRISFQWLAMSIATALVMALGLLAFDSVSADELYQTVSLPDMGFGSRANGLNPGLGSSRGDVVGEMTLPNGLQVPVHWRHDASTGSIFLTELPIPAGYQGRANGLESYGVGKHIVIGTLTDGNGVSHAAFWREDEPAADGSPVWFASQFLPDMGYGSRANDLSFRHEHTRPEGIGEMTTPGGLTIPVRWTINLETGAVSQEQLPLPTGFEGTANGLTPTLGSTRGDVVGEMTSPNGVTVPVYWRYDAATDSTLLTELPIPAGFQGVANGLESYGVGKHIVIGTLTDEDGVSHAAFWREDEPAADGSAVWFGSQLLPDVGQGSRPNGLTPDIGSSRGDVVGEMTTLSGLIVPVRWTVDLESGAVTQEQLPMPLGSEGTANGLLPGIGSSRGDVVGTISTNGNIQAVQWISK